MSYPSTTKIESRAISALQNIINAHLTMDAQFNSHDKEMAWDGYIYIFKKNNGDISKANWDDRVPVQVKGHIDRKDKYLNKQRVTYQVQLEDLEIYFYDRGVLYFEIFMSEDGKQTEIFYASLYPSKIKSYLDLASRKKKKESISVSFNKLKKDANELYIVTKQFSQESRRQGFGSGEIVQNTIMLKDMDKVTSLTATAVGVKNEFEFLQRLSTGDICFYGTTEDNKIKVPLAWNEYCKHYLSKQIKQSVSINKKTFYNEYEVFISSNNKADIVLSKNLHIDLGKNKFQFNFVTDIKQLKNDAHFILCLLEAKEFQIGKVSIKYDNFSISEDFKKSLIFIITLENVLEEIEFDYKEPVSTLKSSTQKQLGALVLLKNGKKNNLLPDKVHTFDWRIDGKFMPLIIFKKDDGSIDLCNALYTRKTQTAIKSANGEYYKTPLFANLKADVLANLYYYNYDYFYEQIDESDVNEATVSCLNDAALRLMQAYDINKDKNLLNIAEYVLQKIACLEGQKIYFLINMFQVKKRQGLLNDKDILALKTIPAENAGESFGISVLLEDKEKADFYFEQITEDERKLIVNYPIYSLYQSLD